MEVRILSSLVAEAGLPDSLEGLVGEGSHDWPSSAQNSTVKDGFARVLHRHEERNGRAARPLAIIIGEEQSKRLYGRLASLHADLSPLSSWCHILDSKRFESLDSATRAVSLSGLEAAWTGLIIAESMILGDRAVHSLRLVECLANQTYAIARTLGLWGRCNISDILTRYDNANRIFKRNDVRAEKVRATLTPIWTALSSCSTGDTRAGGGMLQPVIDAVQLLQVGKLDNEEPNRREFLRPLLRGVPEADILFRLDEISPEERVKLFDRFLAMLQAATAEHDRQRRIELGLLCGYLVTVAGGGMASPQLATQRLQDAPEVLAWAYLVGGLGEQVVWTSSFDGLGRLVARELMRPFRLDEAPVCDIFLDEASVLHDVALTDPYGSMRLKQVRSVSVSIVPGVQVSIPLPESAIAAPARAEPKKSLGNSSAGRSLEVGAELGQALADLIWPHLQPRVEREIEHSMAEIESANHGRSKAKRSSQLPLPNDRRR